MGKQRDHAVVIGASVTGSMVAQALSTRFATVTVIDRDELPNDFSTRKGVPQGRHAHGLLAAGERVMNDLFPGLNAELDAAGAFPVNQGQDARWWWAGGYRVRYPSAYNGYFFTRPLHESVLRRRVVAAGNVELISGSVQGLVGNASEVRGVTVDGNTLAADFVVDASGRSAQSLKWLREIGAEVPGEVDVTVGMTYASRLLRRGPSDPFGNEMIVTTPNLPSGKRLGVLFPVEDDQWIVTLGGFFNDQAPTDDAGFLAFAESFATDDIAEVLRVTDPLTEIVTHKLVSSRRRSVQKLSAPPAGLALLGDTVASFNPIYGQGMSSAALQVEAMGRWLDDGSALDGASLKRLYKKVSKIVDVPWQISVGADFVYPETEGKRPPGVNVLNGYITKVQQATHTSPEVCEAMLAVQNLVAPPPSLMKPTLMRKVRQAAKQSPAAKGTSSTAGVTSNAPARV